MYHRECKEKILNNNNREVLQGNLNIKMQRKERIRFDSNIQNDMYGRNSIKIFSPRIWFGKWRYFYVL